MTTNRHPTLIQSYKSSVMVRPELLQSALGRIRIVVPELVLPSAEGRDTGLVWRTDAVRISEPLGMCFWEFIALDHTDDVQLIDFAQRFGPLISTGRSALPGEHMSDARASARDDGLRERESARGDLLSEPLWAWRMCARGIAALYDFVDPGLPPANVETSTHLWSRAPFVVAHWLQNAKPGDEPPRSEILDSLAMRTEVGSDYGGGDWVLTNTLRIAGVGPAYDSDADLKGSSYTLAARPLESEGTYETRGLLPVLVVSLALAAQTQERPRCTWCKKPAAIIHRGPRKGRPWYGDHEVCRALARAETMIRAEDKRAELRRQQSQANAQVRLR